MHLVTLATNEGTVAQRTELTPDQRRILERARRCPNRPGSTTSPPPPTSRGL